MKTSKQKPIIESGNHDNGYSMTLRITRKRPVISGLWRERSSLAILHGAMLKGTTLLVLCSVLLNSGCSQGVRRIDYSVDKLTATLKDKDPNMRYWAAESLGHYG